MNEIESKVAFFLPTFNEEKSIKRVITDIKKAFNGYFFVVDGYSTDRTVEISRSMGIEVYNRCVPGKGAAFRKALEVASANNKEFLVFIDCDNTYDPKDIGKILENIELYDLVIGVRPMNKIHGFMKKFGNVFVTELMNILYNGHIKDSISGFKCLRVNKFKNIITEDGFAADALICVLALKYKMSVNTVPINYYEERTGNSKMSLWIGIKELAKFTVALIRLK
jgi:glycosyltransferase involved in cell wall biosynthesis